MSEICAMCQVVSGFYILSPYKKTLLTVINDAWDYIQIPGTPGTPGTLGFTAGHKSGHRGFYEHADEIQGIKIFLLR